MALWKISVKTSGTVNGIRLEKGMSVECITTSTSNPLQTNLTKNKPMIGQLFMNKYGVDLDKAGLISTGRLTCEKIG